MAQIVGYLELWLKRKSGDLDCAIIPPGVGRRDLVEIVRKMVLPHGPENFEFVGIKIQPEDEPVLRGVKMKDGTWTWEVKRHVYQAGELGWRKGRDPRKRASQEVLV